MTTPSGPPCGLPVLLDYPAVAKLLGLCVRQVANLVKAGRLRAVRLGPRSVRFDPADVRRFVDEAKGGGA